ncbi:MAG: SAM-dependent methyltransferase [Patescibacteria group bacterium]|nr:TlyA family rRNA (cytidine-2'-O)-methyltransferase [Patescibacteria group bacterium]
MQSSTDKMFVSRAGEKLEHALNTFKIDLRDKICADFGCSTGGFTDCMLQHGATKVYAVDTGYGVLDWKLRNDARVKVLEKTNAIFINLPEPVDFITVDVGWTPQSKIIPNALANLKPQGKIVSLIKPHYEAERGMLTRGRLEDKFTQVVLNKVKRDIEQEGGKILEIVRSPIVGSKGGNTEFLALLIKPS